jgi:DNA (cytosine-5)-methyltransferase 1
MSNKLTVIDFFGGAGGFSEGFRQQGFEVIKGVDYWKPAVDTFNHNFGLDGKSIDVLEYAEDIEIINQLPDSDVILGSPPCVSFSSSNKQGGADKTLGISLIETFFRIVAVKKHQPNSNLKAWYMENVSNSIKHTKDTYTFSELNLTEWANKHGINPDSQAINFIDNHKVLSSFDFGVAQARKRLFAGEVIRTGKFPDLEHKIGKTVREIFKEFPKPFGLNKVAIDPNYPDIKLNTSELTDHYYDTGIYKAHWDYSKYCKVNHPYMGRMSFPENLENPSRTITATKLDNSREALIYHDELGRKGNGQYRTPTIREIAVLMSFPITYQFLGSENSKWRLIGNAVTPLISAEIARSTLSALDLPVVEKPLVELRSNLDGVINLNNPEYKLFDKLLIRKKGSRFRRHPFKEGNMTVALSNYCLKQNSDSDGVWRTTVTYGTGKGYKLQQVDESHQEKIKEFIIQNFDDGEHFIRFIMKDFLYKVSSSFRLQDIYEKNLYKENFLHPAELINEVHLLVSKYANGEVVDAGEIFQYKKRVHKKQVYALFIINVICQITKGEQYEKSR